MYEVGKVIDRIDWKLLRSQKEALRKSIGALGVSSEIYGLVHLLDDLQDAVIEDGLYTEKEVFGPGEMYEELTLLQAAEWVLMDALDRGECRDKETGEMYEDWKALSQAVRREKERMEV